MSLINQVLSDLEKRGAGGVPGGSAIRPVSVQTDRRKVFLSLAGFLGLFIIVAAGVCWGLLPHYLVTAEPVITVHANDQVVSAPVENFLSGTVSSQQDDAPTLILSSELSSIPLPSSLRNNGNGQYTSAENQLPPAKLPDTSLTEMTSHADQQEKRVSQRKTGEQAVAGQRELKVQPALPLSPLVTSVTPAPVLMTGEVQPITISVQAKPVPADSKTSPVASPATNNKALSSPQSPVVKQPGSVDKQIKQFSPQQQADNEFRKANILTQQGRIAEALTGYVAALQLDAGHDDARQAMVSLLLDRKRNVDAEGILQEGLNHNPKQIGFAKLLARLQVDRGALPQALETLQKALPYAGQQSDFQAFIAAVQQRMGQHKEAISHYRVALQSSPDSGVWLMGLGISLKALQQHEEAHVAFKRALESHTLNEELQAFVTQQIKEL